MSGTSVPPETMPFKSPLDRLKARHLVYAPLLLERPRFSLTHWLLTGLDKHHIYQLLRQASPQKVDHWRRGIHPQRMLLRRHIALRADVKVADRQGIW